MSDEKRDLRRSAVDASVPEDLSIVAEWLSRAELPGTTVSRDELLYRAGWEAAARHLCGVVSPSSRRRQRWVTAGWSVANALIGIALTIALINHNDGDVALNERPTHERPTSDDPAPASTPTVNKSALEPQLAQSTRDTTTAPLAAPSLRHPRTYAPSATLLIERERAVWQSQEARWQHDHERASLPALQSAPRRPASNSAREMLQEFLPDVPYTSQSSLRGAAIHSMDGDVDSPTNCHSLYGTTDHPQA